MLTLRLLGVVGAVMLALAMGVRPGAAMVIYPWCVQYGGISSGTLNCGFTSFNQCLATARGSGASCVPNQWYTPFPPPPSYRPPIRR